jgi:diguanylate cyclase (GGDEF)-like protein
MDPLTELANRRALMDRLRQERSRVARHGGSAALILADVDHFKCVNDEYGHHVGDRVLCAVAAVLAAAGRQSDLPARYGGDEFAVLAPDEDAAGAARLADRLRQKIQDIRIKARGNTIRVTASFGVADMTGDASEQLLIRRADEALYRAKRSGRNRVEIATRQEPPVPLTAEPAPAQLP